ncbi:MAG: glycosyltransferase family 4 protein [Comamonas sp.]
MQAARKPHVLFLTRKWPPAIGGMENYSLNLAQSMSEMVNIYTHALPGRMDGRPPSMRALLLFFFSSAAAIIKQRKVDVIHIGDFVLWPLFLVARIFNRQATVAITAFGLDLLYAEKNGILPKIYRHYLRLCHFFCAKNLKVIAISSATGKICKEKGYQSIKIAPLGVTVSKGEALSADSTEARTPFVLFVGRLVKRKGAAWFASHVLPELPPEIKMIVVGKKWDQEEFQILMNSPRVDYRGTVSQKELKKLRREAIAVLMPNIPGNGADMEGFGLTALEAAADSGILIASGIEGIVDAVIDGQTGFLLPTMDTMAWQEKIQDIQKWNMSKRNDFTSHALKILKENYSWSRVAKNTIEAYRS